MAATACVHLGTQENCAIALQAQAISSVTPTAVREKITIVCMQSCSKHADIDIHLIWFVHDACTSRAESLQQPKFRDVRFCISLS